MAMIDHTHAAEARSWVDSANGHADFPIQNLPLGRFTCDDGARVGIAIGDQLVDLSALCASGLMSEAGASAARAAFADTACQSNGMVALTAQQRLDLRRDLFRLLSAGNAAEEQQDDILRDRRDCSMILPATIGDFTDFNAGIHHAANGGRRRKLPNPLLPNYCHVPIAYHGRASSVRVSGTDVIRPAGQFPETEGADRPHFGTTGRIDFELELGIWVGRGNELGSVIPIEDASDHIAGFCLLNDWSARDIQAWESQRLGPFLGKNFLTTVSPWVISPEAMAPFRIEAFRRDEYPQPLPYLMAKSDQDQGGLGLDLEAHISTAAMRAAGSPAHRLTRSHASALFWTPAQMLTHHASNGCPLRSGDLLGTGTISLADPEGYGSFLELTNAGADPIAAGGEERAWIEDGDEISLSARAQRPGFASIGFGECIGRVVPNKSLAAVASRISV